VIDIDAAREQLLDDGVMTVVGRPQQRGIAVGIGDLRFSAGFEQRGRNWRVTGFVRVNNVSDRQYIGSVIVSDANNRFYEPAPGRNWLAGISGEFRF
jgi:iron complex outermembrane receptor protein